MKERSIQKQIQEALFALQDKKYRDFQIKLIPNIPPKSVIGVRTPAIKALAKEFSSHKKIAEFLSALPHRYFDENQMHAFVISGIKDFDVCIKEVERFLPFVDNWATCDQLSPRAFKKNKALLLPFIQKWIRSERTYTVRFAIGMLMQHFLDEDFDARFLNLVASVKSEEYYVNMMIAWHFATALAKRWNEALPFVQGTALEPWTRAKAIQKALESRRILPEQKEYLRSIK